MLNVLDKGRGDGILQRHVEFFEFDDYAGQDCIQIGDCQRCHLFDFGHQVIKHCWVAVRSRFVVTEKVGDEGVH